MTTAISFNVSKNSSARDQMSSLASHENQVFVWIESREPILINSIRMKYDPRYFGLKGGWSHVDHVEPLPGKNFPLSGKSSLMATLTRS